MPHSSLQATRLDFWTGFAAWLTENSEIRPPKPCVHGFVRFGIGCSGFYIGALITRASTLNGGTGRPGVQIELVMHSDEAKTHFRALVSRRAELEREIGLKLIVHSGETVKSAKLWVREDLDFLDRSKWPECFAWLCRHLQKFVEVFGPILKKI